MIAVERKYDGEQFWASIPKPGEEEEHGTVEEYLKSCVSVESGSYFFRSIDGKVWKPKSSKDFKIL